MEEPEKTKTIPPKKGLRTKREAALAHLDEFWKIYFVRWGNKSQGCQKGREVVERTPCLAAGPRPTAVSEESE